MKLTKKFVIFVIFLLLISIKLNGFNSVFAQSCTGGYSCGGWRSFCRPSRCTIRECDSGQFGCSWKQECDDSYVDKDCAGFSSGTCLNSPRCSALACSGPSNSSCVWSEPPTSVPVPPTSTPPPANTPTPRPGCNYDCGAWSVSACGGEPGVFGLGACLSTQKREYNTCTSSVPGCSTYYQNSVCSNYCDCGATTDRDGQSCASPPSPPCPSIGSPSNITTSCGAGNQMTVTWSPGSNADFYSLRLDDLSNGWNGCPPTANPGDRCDDVSGTSITYPVTPGRTYNFWMHSRSNCNVGAWEPSAGLKANNLNCAVSACTIQGFKTIMPNNQAIAPAARQMVRLNGAARTTTNPYFITVPGNTTSSVSVSIPSGYTTQSSFCTNQINCHTAGDPSFNTGSSRNVYCPAGGYADLWWHYSLTATIPPTITPTATPTPTPYACWQSCDVDNQCALNYSCSLINGSSGLLQTCPDPQTGGEDCRCTYDLLFNSCSSTRTINACCPAFGGIPPTPTATPVPTVPPTRTPTPTATPTPGINSHPYCPL